MSVQSIAAGGGSAILSALRRRGVPRVVVLTRRATAPELLVLLQGGVRGAVAGAVDTTAAPTPPRHAGNAPDLSAREVGVLRLVADGHSNRRIGEDLGLSALTVKSHLARISRKLGTGDRAQLVAILMRAGLID